MSSIQVSIPASGRYVHVVRSVIASVAALRDFSFDEIEDLRLAVDEACSHLLRFAPSAASLLVRIDLLDSAIDVLACSDGDAEQWPPPAMQQDLTWQVLSALADRAGFETGPDGPAIRFLKGRSVDA